MTPEEILGHRPRLLSQAQREFFFANGYLLVERAIGAAWLSRLREAFETLEKKGKEPDCPADFELETLPDGRRRLRQVLCAADYHPEIWNFVSSAPMTALAADVVGPDVQFRESGTPVSGGTRRQSTMQPASAARTASTKSMPRMPVGQASR